MVSQKVTEQRRRRKRRILCTRAMQRQAALREPLQACNSHRHPKMQRATTGSSCRQTLQQSASDRAADEGGTRTELGLEAHLRRRSALNGRSRQHGRGEALAPSNQRKSHCLCEDDRANNLSEERPQAKVGSA